MNTDPHEYRTVIVWGGAATGKTHHGRDLARAMTCREVVDEWRPGAPLIPGALHLTDQRPPYGAALPGHVLIMSIDAAIAAAFIVGAI